MSPKLAPKTNIVILNWNSHEMTAECIRSLQAMDSSDFEILIVDNGSADGSVKILAQEFPQITVLPQERNLGFAAGCNVGMRHALAQDAEYVLLLNNDTFVAPDFLREILAAIQNDPRIGAICPKIYFADQPEMLWYAGADFSLWTGTAKHRGWKEVDRGQFDRHEEITQATGCAMLVRCSALRDVGLLDEQFWAYVEDLDWSLRFLKRGYRLAFAPKARLWHCCGATSVKSMGAGSQALRQFFSTRNMIFLARKHIHWWQIPTYAFGFMFNHIAFYTALRLWRRDFWALFAIYRGLSHGLRTSLSSGWAMGPRLSQKEEVLDANRN
jgi:GT2 family glycosyltransferase